MVSEALSKRIHGAIGLMLIYGNTPRDIMAMIWRRKNKIILFFAVIVVALVLTGCGTANKEKNFELKAMDKFWKALGGETEDLVEKAE